MYGTLKLPYGTLEDITPLEIGLLLEGHYETQREELELLSYVIKVSVASAHSGKNIPLFEPRATGKEKKLFTSKEEKLDQFSSLLELF